MKFIREENGRFLLSTRRSCYAFEIGPYGHPEQLHYGSPVTMEDLPALRYAPVMPYGSEVLYTPENATYCLDNRLLEWSGMGKGDFRNPPIELCLPDGSLTTDFIYEGYCVIEGAAPCAELPSAAAAEGEAETLILRLRERKFALTLELIYTVFPQTDVIARRAVLTNQENNSVSLRRFLSMQLDLPDKGYALHTLDGDWICEAQHDARPLIPGQYLNSSSTGGSSNRHNPGVMLAELTANEDCGAVYGFNLVYSGNHYTAAELSFQRLVRVSCGINPLGLSWTLAPGERFETPQAVLTYSNEGFNGLSRNFHEFVNEQIVRGDWKGKERPVLFNNWEADFFDFTRRKLLRLARRAKKLGAELFVLDDGWFGNRNTDKAGLGDYTVNRKKLPDGIDGLARRVHGMGLMFGLWFEPESVNPDSDLFRAHPEYAVCQPGRAPSYGRNQLILDLTQPAVRDYIVENLCHLLDTAGIDYVKWDMNRHMSDIYSPTCPAGEFQHRYILGLYDILARVFYTRPHILLESCSSGGNRFDLGMLCFSPQIWASDDTDPIERLRIQKGLSYFYPPSTMGAHVSQAPHQQTLRATPLSTRFNVAAFGSLGYELDPCGLSRTECQQIKDQIAFYKAHRRVFQFGRFYRYRLPRQDREIFLAVDQTQKTAVLLLAQTLARAGDAQDYLSVKGLCDRRRYLLQAVPQKVAVARFGGLVKHLLPFTLRPDGFILRHANRIFALPDGAFSCEASGAALCAGIPLNSQFIGTGYHPDLRLWGDFGSQLYVIEQAAHDEEERL